MTDGPPREAAWEASTWFLRFLWSRQTNQVANLEGELDVRPGSARNGCGRVSDWGSRPPPSAFGE
jgi:hypothetical protein